MINLNRISRAVMIFVGAFAASLTGIQAMAAEEESQFIEEIIVTSTYRETNLMDTPQSIGAVTAQLVEDLGAQSMADIYMMVPGLNMLGDRDGENRYAIRGLTSQTDTRNTLTIDAYQKTNARITLRDPNEKWRVGLFATNLTNEEIVRNRSGASTLYWYQPRQIGLEVGYKM